MLEAASLSKEFQGVHALSSVDISVAAGTIVGLIGPNGSGKTTVLNCMSGLLRPTAGTVRLDGERIAGLALHEIARRGIARTFQNIRLFGTLTSFENVQASALAAGRASWRSSRDVAARLLEEFGLTHLAEVRAGALSYGDQRRLEMARALSGSPRFVLLDEPAAGMNEVESDELVASLRRVRRERGCGVVIVEHDFQVVAESCDDVYVLNEGHVISHGAPVVVQADPAVQIAYLGEEPDRGMEAG